MNLSTFVTNESEVMNRIPKNDRAGILTSKVLENSETDQFELSIRIKRSDIVSKRVVAQQIASIYDPLGWFIPLLVTAKAFQQKLWKERHEWDENLNDDLKNEWLGILSGLEGYRRLFPRRTLRATRRTRW
ncbi:unnamed protein product [Heligmosomoides polygyrus]|uniref:Uncharacterized protein n=1 Tax=Heligmosomoides polygyrus TaxID=6339 RepID=A0A183GJN8_HELPZ|nr:unnamed protein product [Heligmosomoides polygyrus]